jgi:hypothetical protein
LWLRTFEKEAIMKRSLKAAGVAAALSLGVAAVVFAHPGQTGGGMDQGMMHGMGPGTAAGPHGPMGGPMAGGMQHDDAFADDMQLVRGMLFSHDRIKRTVTNLPDGIKTVTESDDPQVAQAIQTHVASMVQRLGDGKEFNLFSKTIPVLFENRDKINTTVETTAKGSVVTQTSSDAKVVTALQEHATEVDELVRDGMAAMMRGMMARRGDRAAQR